jgi:hypothetical protein
MNSPFEIRHICEKIFHFVVTNGHINITKWMIGIIGKNNITNVIGSYWSYCFMWGCKNRNVKIIIWLYKIDIENNEYSVKTICNNEMESFFEYACKNGHINVTK